MGFRFLRQRILVPLANTMFYRHPLKKTKGIMALVRNRLWLCVSAAICLAMAGLTERATAASAVPAGGANWTLVNQVFTNAIARQQAAARRLDGRPAPVASPPAASVVPTQPIRPASGRQSTAPAESAPPATSEMADVDAGPKGAWGWLSEVQGGLLAHSVAISTDTPKEGGVDGNLEVLFVSPDFMDIVWSPRPHIGASFNASSDDTDQVYTGLTWEWMPWGPLFIDFSLGFSVHNGRLHAEPGDTDTDERREFGCRWLFRESIELGFVFQERHSLSGMWDHISHGGICDDENEGMDNVGVRYGYRF